MKEFVQGYDASIVTTMLPERIFVADFMLLLLLLLLVLLTPTTKKNTNKVVVVLLMLQQFAGQPVRTMGGAWPRTCATADTDFTDLVARSANLEDGSSFEGILPVVCVIAYRLIHCVYLCGVCSKVFFMQCTCQTPVLCFDGLCAFSALKNIYCT